MSNAQDVSSLLWTPDEMTHTAVEDHAVFSPSTHEKQRFIIHKFRFKFLGKQHDVQVVAKANESLSVIEDNAAIAFEDWVNDLKQQEHKRTPTPEEKVQIGHALNEFHNQALKRRESSSGVVNFKGVN
jgi:hypothetical protein